MKKKSFIQKLAIIILAFYTISSYAQEPSLKLGFRIDGQADFQRETFAIPGFFGGGVKEHKGIPFNYGFDILAIKKIKPEVSIYGGLGYFHNRFNFTKEYDHQLLNQGRDSFPIGTATKNYIYSLLRVPLGIDLLLKTYKNKRFSFSIENDFNFSFLHTYNGAKPFPNANNKLHKFKFYGDNILLRISVIQSLKNGNTISLSPYMRLFNLYNHTDPILYRDETGNYIRWIDAIGLSVTYSFSFKK